MADLTKRIMRRVYLIWFARQVFNTLTLKVALIALLLSQFVEHVSIKNVIANWHADWGIATSYAFLQSAVLETEFIVQMIMAGFVVLGSLLVRDIVLKRKVERLFIQM